MIERPRRHSRHAHHRSSATAGDRGSVLIFVLVTVAICSLIAIPMLNYIFSVFRSSEVQSDRAQAIELADGGTWVALSNRLDLYDACNGGTLPVSLTNVTTTCDVLATTTQRPVSEVPFHVASVQQGTSIPASFASSNSYANSGAAAAQWLTTPGWTKDSVQGKVWIPELPVRATSAGSDHQTTMIPGTQDPNYASCRVFFPGTFTSRIVIDGPTYFTSGIYYFAQPIVLQPGADVVVGNGAEVGCTTDFEAIASAVKVPDPLNAGGLGGTFVFGERGRITVDDSAGTGSIRFAMNQRYVSELDAGGAASSDVAIVSVNGDHAPYAVTPAPEPGGDLTLDTLQVPASRVGVDSSPLATSAGYQPSVLTPKPTQPGVPEGVAVETYKNSNSSSGLVKVRWNVPNANGALITSYTATDSVSGRSCETRAPAAPATTVRPFCTIDGLSNGAVAKVSVVARNAYGSSPASAEVTAPAVSLSSSTTIGNPLNPPSTTTKAFSNGLQVGWNAPNDQGRSSTTGYRVTATPTLTGSAVSCEARWDETSCVLPLPAPLDLANPPTYSIVIRTLSVGGSPQVETRSSGANVATLFAHVPGSEPAPVTVPATAGTRVPDAIVDFTTERSTPLDVTIDGYVAVPQGRVAIAATDPASASVRMIGGVVAGEIVVGPDSRTGVTAGAPATAVLTFDNPVAQKQMRIVSVHDGKARAASEAIVQLNRSGSLAINSWIVQGGDPGPPPAPTTTPPSTTTTTTVPVATTSTTTTTTTAPATTTTVPTTTTTVPTTTTAPTVTTTTVPTTTTPTTTTTTTTTTVPPGCSDASKWAGKYWSNRTLTGNPEVQRCDDVIDFNWGTGGPVSTNDNFSARWTKTRNFGVGGNYAVTIGADDGIRMFVDGVKVYDRWTDKAFSTETISVPISAGDHVITVEYYENSSGAQAYVNIAASPTPATTTTTTTLPPCPAADTTWRGEYYETRPYLIISSKRYYMGYRNDASPNFDWGSGPPATGLQSNNFDVEWTKTENFASAGTYRFTVGGDDGVRLYVNGTRVLDSWSSSTTKTVDVVINDPCSVNLRLEYRENTGDARVNYSVVKL